MPAGQNFYEVMQVHPAAPVDLIGDAYWRLVSRVQERRGKDPNADLYLYHLTRAYRTLSDAAQRAAYDEEIGVTEKPGPPSLRPKRRSFFGRMFMGANLPDEEPSDGKPDFYRVMRLHPSADPVLVPQAYEVMRNSYLRLVRMGEAPVQLLVQLDEAYRTLSDPTLRAQYDAKRGGIAEPQEAPETNGAAPPAQPALGSPVPAIRSKKRTADQTSTVHATPSASTAKTVAADRSATRVQPAAQASAGSARIERPESATQALSGSSTVTEVARDAKTAERLRIVAQAAGQTPAEPPADRRKRPDVVDGAPQAAIPPVEEIREVVTEEPPPGPSMAEKVAPVLKAVLASMARALAVGATATYRWLVANVPVAARWTGRAARGAGRRMGDWVRTWRRVAAELAEERRLGRPPRIEVPDGPLPDEEEAVISRLKAGANGSSSALADFPLRAYLTVAQGNSNGSLEFDIERSPVLLGSADNSDISIPGIAPYEARLVYREGQFIMFSLTDVHGIRANGEAAAWAVLEDGTQLAVGPYTLRFHVVPK